MKIAICCECGGEFLDHSMFGNLQRCSWCQSAFGEQSTTVTYTHDKQAEVYEVEEKKPR